MKFFITWILFGLLSVYIASHAKKESINLIEAGFILGCGPIVGIAGLFHKIGNDYGHLVNPCIANCEE